MSRRPAPPAFTLVELLIVLLLMGIIYAIAFKTMVPRTSPDQQEEAAVTLAHIDRLFRQSDGYGEKALTLYGTEEGKAYLVTEGRVVRKIDLPQTARAYRLNPDETLQSVDYGHLKFGSLEIVPLFAIRCRRDGYLDPQILLVGERWLYIHPYKTPRFFDDPVAMIADIRQTAYLPGEAGYAQ